MNRDRLFSVLADLDLPTQQYAVFGGSCLTAHGIREAEDLELFVRRGLFDALKKRGWKESVTTSTHSTYVTSSIGEVSVLAFIRCGSNEWVPDVDAYIRNPDIIDGYPFMPLEAMRSWKIATARPKDLEDVELIDRYLKLQQR